MESLHWELLSMRHQINKDKSNMNRKRNKTGESEYDQ